MIILDKWGLPMSGTRLPTYGNARWFRNIVGLIEVRY